MFKFFLTISIGLFVVQSAPINAQSLFTIPLLSQCEAIDSLKSRLNNGKITCKNTVENDHSVEMLRRLNWGLDEPKYCHVETPLILNQFRGFSCLLKTGEHTRELFCYRPLNYQEIQHAKDEFRSYDSNFRNDMLKAAECNYGNGDVSFQGRTMQGGTLDNFVKYDFGVMASLGKGRVSYQRIKYSFGKADPTIDWGLGFLNTGLESMVVDVYKQNSPHIFDNLDDRLDNPKGEQEDGFINTRLISNFKKEDLKAFNLDSIKFSVSSLDIPTELKDRLPVAYSFGSIQMDADTNKFGRIANEGNRTCQVKNLDGWRNCVEMHNINSALEALTDHLWIYNDYDKEEFSELPAAERNQFLEIIRASVAQMDFVDMESRVTKALGIPPTPFASREYDHNTIDEEFDIYISELAVVLPSTIMLTKEFPGCGVEGGIAVFMAPLKRGLSLVDVTNPASIGVLTMALSACGTTEHQQKIEEVNETLKKGLTEWVFENQ